MHFIHEQASETDEKSSEEMVRAVVRGTRNALSLSMAFNVGFAVFSLLLAVAIRGDSTRYLKGRDVLECLSEMDSECVAEALKLMPRRGVSPGKDVTLREIAGSDLMDSDGNPPKRFPIRRDEENADGRGDDTGMVMLPIIFGLKLLGLFGVVAVKHFLLKAILLAKMSLIVSGWLIFQAISRAAQKYKDLLQSSPNQYPKNEPDLSGYGYMSTNGYHDNNDEDLVLAALNKTLMSWPRKKWRIVSSDSSVSRENAEFTPFNPSNEFRGEAAERQSP